MIYQFVEDIVYPVPEVKVENVLEILNSWN